jgi:hypothetical protein
MAEVLCCGPLPLMLGKLIEPVLISIVFLYLELIYLVIELNELAVCRIHVLCIEEQEVLTQA